jgi:hypothetical protein
MGQVLHGCATTTEAIRRAIQNSQESLRALSKRYGINPKTVAKWKQRGSVTDLPTGPATQSCAASWSNSRAVYLLPFGPVIVMSQQPSRSSSAAFLSAATAVSRRTVMQPAVHVPVIKNHMAAPARGQ